MVVVWGSEDILSTSIKSFLAPKDDWKVVSISSKEDLDALILTTEFTHLYVVIIHQKDDESLSNLPAQLLQDYPAIKVIMINFNNNMMEVYNKQEFLVQEASDLIAVIENGV